MDKELDELRDDIRRTLQAINDNLQELDDYLTRLRRQTIAELNELKKNSTLARHALTQVPAGTFVATADEPTPDPRFPYLAGRQPRRDGDSFGSVLPRDEDRAILDDAARYEEREATAGDAHGSKAALERQRRRTEREEKT